MKDRNARLEAPRADFPLLTRRINDRPIIYLDSAATSLKPQVVIDAVTRFYTECTANVHRAVHTLSEEATEAFEEARATVARFIGADDREVAFTRNATEAINVVAASRREGVVAIPLSEHHSNQLPWRQSEWCPLGLLPSGEIDLAIARRTLRDVQPSLVAFSTVSNALGTPLPVAELTAAAREIGAEVLLDISQSVGHGPVDVAEYDCDFACFSGHKMLGPSGVGVLYQRENVHSYLRPLLTGGSMIQAVHSDHYVVQPFPWGIEAGTPNIEAVLGLAAACEYLDQFELSEILAHGRTLVHAARAGLHEIKGIHVLGNPEVPSDSIVAFTVDGMPAHGVARQLSNRFTIMARSGYHCAQPLHEGVRPAGVGTDLGPSLQHAGGGRPADRGRRDHCGAMMFAAPEVLHAHEVAVATGFDAYGPPPFSPDQAWPEYPFGCDRIGARPNPAYAGVRTALQLLGLDRSGFGTVAWNPLGELIRPGETVVLKPNFVRDFRETQLGHGNCLITHGAVIRAVADYVYRALQGEGRIVIADAPQNDADFAQIRLIAGLDALQAFYRDVADFDLELYDLRPESARKIDGVIVGHEALSGDPAGYVCVDLGEHSLFAEIKHLCHLLYGAEYDTSELRRHHHDDVHEYLVSATILGADVVISLPKLKTHKKTGLTASLKNVVGINGNKNWLPHHREGTPEQGGDQFATNGIRNRLERVILNGFKQLFPMLGPLRRSLAAPAKAIGQRVFGNTNTDTIRSGNWHGNDTTWRMVLDLNRILLYATPDGILDDRPARRVFTVVDAIVAGEGNGPLDATPKQMHAVLAGRNPVAVDAVCGRLMGIDCQRVPLLRAGFEGATLRLARFDPCHIRCHSNVPRYDRAFMQITGACFDFRPHFGWRGKLEIDRHGPAVALGEVSR